MSSAMAYLITIDRSQRASLPSSRASSQFQKSSPTTSLSSARSSLDSTLTEETALLSSGLVAPSESKFKQAMKAVARHAREHHESVNAAYGLYYGGANVARK
ncbi:hypothetical protein K402DRAFT_424431 [Aulographum hederae CBS 113979]|uniref:Uncharacterized protein n=1 Tax=Aulographum hederae CBS 113979 TaxID=1176131 RepID=A0A6G1GPD5_9PEZI|nr:hypothetical protein K402DRAFT_424431 [Aulographum hederae CBS 113979]